MDMPAFSFTSLSSTCQSSDGEDEIGIPSPLPAPSSKLSLIPSKGVAGVTPSRKRKRVIDSDSSSDESVRIPQSTIAPSNHDRIGNSNSRKGRSDGVVDDEDSVDEVSGSRDFCGTGDHVG
jgi:hypothetical protein